MSIHLKVVLLMAISIYYIILFYFLKKGRFILKYTLLWIFLGISMIFIVLFPAVMNVFTKLCGIQETMNGLFALVCFGMIMLLMSLTAIVSSLNEKNKNLIQTVGILENKVRKLEQEFAQERK